MSSVLTARPAAGAGSRLRAWVARRQLLALVALAYGLTWPYMLVDVLASRDMIAFELPLPLLILQGYGPAIAAAIVAWAAGGGAGVRGLLRPLLAWRVGPGWYAVAILGPGALAALTLALYLAAGGPPLGGPPASWMLLANGLALFLVGGVLNGEEVAWRGYALPALQARHSALNASLVVGALWALFHLPQFFIEGGAFASAPPLSFVARTLAMAVLFTWVYSHTGGSLLLVTMLHASINTWTRVLPIERMEGAYAWLPAAVFCLAAALVLAIYGPGRLARAELSSPR